jgi:hypothetical protein
MNFFSVVPKPLRDLIPYLSPRALRVVDRREAGLSFVKLGRNLLLKTDYRAGLNTLTSFLAEKTIFDQSLVVVDAFSAGAIEVLAADASLRPKIGNALLTLYFSEMFYPGPVFLDFRLRHFRMGKKGTELQWLPSAARMTFSANFKSGLRDIYLGFYRARPAQLEKGLTGLGLIGKNPQQQEIMVALIKKHLLGADHGAVAFSSSHFKESFSQFFAVLIENKIKLPTDFIYLGLMLASLHLSLEAIGGAFDCAKIFRGVAE